tara:strand:+ start:712982 stop:713608 length:627 start_codon:yes stop_codon:yes gene_type:complete
VLTLLIARHGNTFDKGDIPTRVGARTDLPLVEKGREQARHIANYLKENDILPDIIFTSDLRRTKEMAEIIVDELRDDEIEVRAHPMFNEIDYGPDENKTEDEVIARIGADAIAQWDKDAIVPDGWIVDPQTIIQNWRDFSEEIVKNYSGKIVMVITSNGVARFVPYLTGEFEAFSQNNAIKISTGGLCILEKHANDATWTVKQWNIRP